MSNKIALITGSFVLSIVCATFNATSASDTDYIVDTPYSTDSLITDNEQNVNITGTKQNTITEKKKHHRHKNKNQHRKGKHGSHKDRTINNIARDA